MHRTLCSEPSGRKGGLRPPPPPPPASSGGGLAAGGLAAEARLGHGLALPQPAGDPPEPHHAARVPARHGVRERGVGLPRRREDVLAHAAPPRRYAGGVEVPQRAPAALAVPRAQADVVRVGRGTLLLARGGRPEEHEVAPADLLPGHGVRERALLVGVPGEPGARALPEGRLDKAGAVVARPQAAAPEVGAGSPRQTLRGRSGCRPGPGPPGPGSAGAAGPRAGAARSQASPSSQAR